MSSTAQLNEARAKMVGDWLFVAHSMRTCADSINRYISCIASTPSHAEVLKHLVQLPALTANNLPQFSTQLGVQASGSLPGSYTIPGLEQAKVASNANKRSRESDGGLEADGKGDGTVNANGKPAKKVKKDKDPNEPKRPASAYITFQNSIREEMKSLHPELPYRELISKISERWNSLTEDEKKVYSHKAETAMQKWKEDLAEYKGEPAPEVKQPKKVNAPKAAATTAPAHAAVAPPAIVEDTSSEDDDDSTVAAAIELVKRKTAPISSDEDEDSSSEPSSDEEETSSSDDETPAVKVPAAVVSTPKVATKTQSVPKTAPPATTSNVKAAEKKKKPRKSVPN